MGVTIHWRSTKKLLAYEGPVIFAVIAGPDPDAREDDIEHPLELIEARLERYPAIAVLFTIEHGSPTPSPDERRRMQAALAAFEDRLVVGYAFCGLGFWANTIRAILVGVSRLAGSPVIAHSTVEAAAEHIARELVGIDSEQIARTGQQLRALLREDSDLAATG